MSGCLFFRSQGQARAMSSRIFTIGSSTRRWEEFLAVLAAFGIQALADLRRFPVSRRYQECWMGNLKNANDSNKIRRTPCPVSERCWPCLDGSLQVLSRGSGAGFTFPLMAASLLKITQFFRGVCGQVGPADHPRAQVGRSSLASPLAGGWPATRGPGGPASVYRERPSRQYSP